MLQKIPHYHLEEATSVFRREYPDLVRKSDEPVVTAFMRLFHLYDEQVIIPSDTEIHAYKAH